MNFNRGEQRHTPEEDEDDFDWRKVLDEEAREDRKYDKQIKDWDNYSGEFPKETIIDNEPITYIQS